jgi:hypothetical protein
MCLILFNPWHGPQNNDSRNESVYYFLFNRDDTEIGLSPRYWALPLVGLTCFMTPMTSIPFLGLAQLQSIRSLLAPLNPSAKLGVFVGRVVLIAHPLALQPSTRRVLRMDLDFIGHGG